MIRNKKIKRAIYKVVINNFDTHFIGHFVIRMKDELVQTSSR